MPPNNPTIAPHWLERKVPVDQLRPYEANPRTISNAAYAKLKASIQELGFHQRILVQPDLRVIGGHQRIRALKELGILEIAVLIPNRELTEKEFKRLLIQDNVPFGEFDWPKLQTDFAFDDLKDWGLPLDWLAKAKPPFDDAAAEDTPALQTKVVSRTGDLWLLGQHRLLCGDATSESDVATCFGGSKAVLMQTDPPYGIAYVKNAQTKGQNVRHADIENDELDGPKLQAFLEATIRAAVPHLSNNCAFYLWHPMLTQGTFFAAAAAADILIHRQIIWCKPSMVFGRGDYHWQHELCFYGWRKGHRPPFYGPRNQTTLWQIERETNKDHPTAKPVALWTDPIRNHAAVEETVYEPFAGTGSQIIAAEQTNRRCVAMEISPAYCDLIVRRWMQFANKDAILESGETFETFEAVEKSRA